MIAALRRRLKRKEDKGLFRREEPMPPATGYVVVWSLDCVGRNGYPPSDPQGSILIEMAINAHQGQRIRLHSWTPWAGDFWITPTREELDILLELLDHDKRLAYLSKEPLK